MRQLTAVTTFFTALTCRVIWRQRADEWDGWLSVYLSLWAAHLDIWRLQLWGRCKEASVLRAITDHWRRPTTHYSEALPPCSQLRAARLIRTAPVDRLFYDRME